MWGGESVSVHECAYACVCVCVSVCMWGRGNDEGSSTGKCYIVGCVI